jgi:hypothetical protein
VILTAPNHFAYLSMTEYWPSVLHFYRNLVVNYNVYNVAVFEEPVRNEAIDEITTVRAKKERKVELENKTNKKRKI